MIPSEHVDPWDVIRVIRNRTKDEEDGDDDDQAQTAADARKEVIRTGMPRVGCCANGSAHLYAFWENTDDEGRPIGAPTWMQGFYKTFPENGYERDDRQSLVIHFCPFCGTGLPQLRAKAVRPEHIASYGMYRCNHCGERSRGCYCYPEILAWEVVPR
jgi:hypothetical protein